MSDEWHEQPFVRVAKTLAGWPRCSAEDFLREIGVVLDKIEDVESHGIGLPALAELAGRARLAEEEAQGRLARHPNDLYVEAQEARDAVRKLFVRDFAPAEIAAIVGLPVDQVEHHVGLHLGKVKDTTKRVVIMGEGGTTPAEIARETGLTVWRVMEILRRHDIDIKTKWTRIAPEKAAAIRADKEAGMTLASIARKHKVSMTKVKNAIYGKRKTA